MATLELTTNLLAEIGGWPALKEARVMVERGRVHDARREGNVIRARVQGAEKINEAQITLADRVANVEVRCTCAESRRTGRVCAHVIAAGLAVLQPGKAPARSEIGRPAGDRPPPGTGTPGAAATSEPRLARLLVEDAPSGTPGLELSVLLPLNLKEALGKDPVRVILEAKGQPLDAVLRAVKGPVAVSEEDDRVLTALERLAGAAAGVNAVARAKMGSFLRALDGHPRVWLGKKERVEVRATAERTKVEVGRGAEGELLLRMGMGRIGRMGQMVLPRWWLEGSALVESAEVLAGFSEGMRTVAAAQVPEFLTRELPVLERQCEIVFAPGTEEFSLEIGQPSFEVKLEGALSGLTLELVAHYGEKSFSLDGKTESSAYQNYFPASASVFWRRNVIAERAALAQVEAAGFSHVRAGANAFSLISENSVARFLANTLARWKRGWTVTPGPRLEATLAQVDIAQPEFSLKGGAGNDWLGLDLKLSVEGKPIAIDQAEVQRWLQTGQSHARMANKRVLLVPTEAWGEMKEVLADCEVEQEPGAVRIQKTFAPFLSGALKAQGFRGGEEGTCHALTGAGTLKAALDEKLLAQLRPYQMHGVEWLAGLAQQDFHGLLADDMGLGKTLQALAFAAWVHRTDRTDRTDRTSVDKQKMGALVVCPTSLVTNWMREAGRFTPQLRTLDLTGADRGEKFSRRGEFDLLVTSYAILRRDIELYRAEEFSLVILDEAQHIKNRGSQNAQSAKALRARHRLILTGTPLENSVLDLWSLFDFLLPGYLGTAAEFRERYETPLAKQPEPKLMERLRYRVKPFFLRRTKEEVLTELPPKLDYPTLIELTAEQREVYRAVLAQGRRDVFEHSDKAGRKSGRDRLAVLTTLLRLRQVCCHLDLLPRGEATESRGQGRSQTESGNEGEGGISHGGGGSLAEGKAATELRGQVRSQIEFGNEGDEEKAATELRGQGRSQMEFGNEGAGGGEARRWKEPSAKMERTFELIDEAIDGGHRVLLFSQFVRVLHLLRAEAARRELRFCYLDGQTVERQAEVDRFQNDAGIPLFFISLKAGGTGLNLTGADTVIHFDPWWNPAVEEQATSRAHRMGQARSVSAYKLIAAGTVEEKIQALQARKRELFEASVGGDAALVEKLTGEDLEELLAE